jgi:hypothetical protein
MIPAPPRRTTELFPRATNKPSQDLDTAQTLYPPHTIRPTLPPVQSHKTPPWPTKISRTSDARVCSSCNNKAAAGEEARAAKVQSKSPNSRVAHHITYRSQLSFTLQTTRGYVIPNHNYNHTLPHHHLSRPMSQSNTPQPTNAPRSSRKS